MATGHPYWRTKWPEPSVGDRAWAVKSPDAPDTFIGYAVYRDRAKADELASRDGFAGWHGPFSVVRVEYAAAVTKLEIVDDVDSYYVSRFNVDIPVKEATVNGMPPGAVLKRRVVVEPARWVEVEDETSS